MSASNQFDNPRPQVFTAGDDFNKHLMNGVADIITWLAKPPEVHYRRAAAQAINANEVTAIVWDTVLRDTHTMVSPYDTPGVFITSTPGWYWIEYRMSWTHTTTTGGHGTAGVYISGSTANEYLLRTDMRSNLSATGPDGVIVVNRAGHFYLAQGDEVSLKVSNQEARSTATTTDRMPELILRWESS